MTDLRPYFTQIIGHNSVNVHRSFTKLGTEVRLNEPFKCAKFQPYWSMHSCFMVDFAKCVKRRNRRKKIKLWPLVSRNGWSDFLHKYGIWTPLTSRNFGSKFGFNQIRNHGATKVGSAIQKIYFYKSISLPLFDVDCSIPLLDLP